MIIMTAIMMLMSIKNMVISIVHTLTPSTLKTSTSNSLGSECLLLCSQHHRRQLPNQSSHQLEIPTVSHTSHG